MMISLAQPTMLSRARPIREASAPETMHTESASRSFVAKPLGLG
jgi:hypothetical protein